MSEFRGAAQISPQPSSPAAGPPTTRQPHSAWTTYRDPLTVGWFDTLYQEADNGQAVVPWADLAPNSHLVAWLDRTAPAPGRALDVGCGYGDNAAELARRGFDVHAFDVSSVAVARAQERFGDLPIRFCTADLFAPPSGWTYAFDLVVEIYTLQVLPPAPRAAALAALARLLAAGGTMIVVARGRDDLDPPGTMPWPLTRAEVARLADHGLVEASFEDFFDDESPPVRRFRSVWHRPT